MTNRDYVELDLPPLHHVGIVVLHMSEAAADFERRWGTHVTDIADFTFNALIHDRPATISLRRGVIQSGGSQIELIQPLSESPLSDFLNERKGDGVHHLAFVVDEIEAYLDRLKPTCAELVLDAWLPNEAGRVVYLDGFAHGPAVELIELRTNAADG
jgi:hypothetical protein